MRDVVALIGSVVLVSGSLSVFACGGDDAIGGGYGLNGGYSASGGASVSAGGADAGGAGGSGGAPTGLGVGSACTSDASCRHGLVCDPQKKTCQPGHQTPLGAPCTLTDDCATGLYCDETATPPACAPGGTGGPQSSCSSDADCAPGLRCDLAGFGGQCEAEGPGDLGQACSGSSDCLAGLACVGMKCAQIPGGSPFPPPTWPGVTPADCNDAPGSVVAYFEVPRAATTPDFYRLPYPNDVRVTGTSLDLSNFPTPGASPLGFDVVQRYTTALATGFDGFGVYETVFFRFSGAFDGATLDGNLHSIDLTTGKDVSSLYYGYSSGGGHYICPNWLAIRPAQGSPYTAGHTYAVYMTTSIKATGGAPIGAPADLTALLAASAPSDPALAPHWPKYQILRDYLAAKSVAPATVLDATVFTVGDPAKALDSIGTQVAAAAAPTASSWTLCDGSTPSPCSDATGDRACPTTPDPDFDELHAIVKLPLWQSGTAPYLAPTDGGGLVLDGTGAPVQQGTQDVCLSLSVPKGGAPAGGFPTVIFAHGTGGSFRTHVTTGVAKDFARGVDDGHGTVVKAAVLGIDQVETGPRRNGSMQSQDDLFGNLANPAAARGNVQQGAADQLALFAFAASVNLPAATSPTGQDVVLGPVAAFFGHSQGATEGAVMLPVSRYPGAVLAGEGASVMNSLVTKTSPVDLAHIVPFVLEDIDATGQLPGAHVAATPGDFDQDHPVLNLIQQWMDPADPISYALTTVTQPAATGAPHAVFQAYGLGDTYSPALTQQTYAIAARLGLVAPDASVGTPDPIGSLTPIPTPASGNLMVGGVAVSAMVREYQPASGKDGHFVVFDVASARSDAERFLAGVLSGAAPQVGP